MASVVMIHEFGHFATAKAFGVKVNEFGFGFPPRVLTVYRRGDTEYTINLLPIGGFVKLEGENDPTDPRSLASKGVGTRFIILVAGVFMNVVLALVLLTALFMFTVGELKVDQVAPNSPAAEAGLLPGDRLLEVNGRDVASFQELTASISTNRGTEVPLLIRRDGKDQIIDLVPRSFILPQEAASGVAVEVVGELTVQSVSPASPADLAGVQPGDIITGLNDLPVNGFYDLTGQINGNRGQEILWNILRGSEQLRVSLVPREDPPPGQGASGIRLSFSGEVRVEEVVPDSSAERAGVLPGDVILEVDGGLVEDFQDLSTRVSRRLGEETDWLIRRGEIEQTISLVPLSDALPYDTSTGITVDFVGVQNTPVRPPWEGLARAISWIGDVAILTKDAVTDWLVDDGDTPFAGPVGIAQGTGEITREVGLISLVPLTALFSISLAFFNILPIPALDGGRLVFVVLEWVRRGKRISPEKEGLVHLVGIVGLMAMLVALTYNDILRIVQGQSLLP